MEPIPTEYQGVCFDSKSEAVFARCLDLAGVHWEKTHPVVAGGHPWDFLVWLPSGKWRGVFRTDNSEYCYGPHFERLVPCLVELKPSNPTVTYVKRLKKAALKYKVDARGRFAAAVIYGSPWSAGDVYTYKPVYGYELSGWPEMARHATEAKRYRFDLVGDESILAEVYAARERNGLHG